MAARIKLFTIKKSLQNNSDIHRQLSQLESKSGEQSRASAYNYIEQFYRANRLITPLLEAVHGLRHA